jgi:hypothetical protein
MTPTKEQVRDAVVDLRHFTLDGLASRLGVSLPTARARVEWAVARGIAERIGTVHLGGRGRPPVLYAYVDPRPRPEPARRPYRRRTPDLVGRLSGPQLATGRRVRTGDKDVDRLLDQAARTGARIDRAGGHVKVYPKGSGRPIPVAGTPGDVRTVRNLRAQLRRAGALPT